MNSLVPSLSALFLLAFIGAAQGKEIAHKTIRITKDSFSDIYPAIWFSPSDGTIAPLTEASEKPPKPSFTIWIEPSDPEIATLDRKAAKEGNQGFQLIGHGERHFKKPVPPIDRKLVSKIQIKDLEKPLGVFLYVEGDKSYVMLVESLSKDKQELTFQWKALESN